MAWAQMMQAAGRMGITPEAFWRLSLKEWRMLVNVPGGEQPLGRLELEGMMRLWPDEGA